MIKHLFILFIFSAFIACSNSEKTVRKDVKLQERELSEKEKVAFGRLYIDASTQKVLGNYEEALKLFSEAISIDPGKAAPYYESALILNGFGKEDIAFESMKRAIEIDPENYWYKFIYAKLLEEKNRIPEAIEIFKDLSKQNPQKIELKYELAKLYYYNQQYKESIEILNEIESEVGVTEEISVLKQKTYLNLNDVDKAAEEIRLLIKAFPNEYRYYVQLADTYMSNNREEEALEVYSRLAELDPDNAQAQLAMSDYYRNKGEPEKALQALKNAMGDDELNIDIKIKYMLSFYQVLEKDLQKKQQALELTKIIAETHPQDAKAQALYADFLYFSDMLPEAKLAYEKTIALDSSRFPVWNQLMLLLSEMNDVQSLVDYGERGVSLFPNQPSIYLYFGSALAQLQQHQKAVEYLEMGSQLVVDNNLLASQFHSSLGDSYHQLDNHEKSDFHYDKALEYDPNNVYVLNNYSYYLSERGEQLEKAKTMSEKSNQLSPGQASFLDTYAWILYKLEEYEEANVWIDKALQSSEESGVILEHKGDILFKLNRQKEALEYWEKAKNVGGASELIDKKIAEKKLYE